MTQFFNRFLKDESGATAIEYGLIAALIAVAIVAAFGALSPKLLNGFNNLGDAIENNTQNAADA